MSHNAQAIAAYVGEHPGCGIRDLIDHFGCDAAGAWCFVLDAERDGLIETVHVDGTPWQFFTPDTPQSIRSALPADPFEGLSS